MRSHRFPSGLRALAVAAAPMIVASSGNIVNGGQACTLDFRYGISATALDAATNADITSGACLIARQGACRDL